MSHALHQYLAQQLDTMLKKCAVVVFYDPRHEFGPFFDRDLQEVETGDNGLPRVLVGDHVTCLARYTGSLFGLRAAVEPIVSQDRPAPLLLYLPGVTRDRQGSILMELEKGGTCYEPQLKRLALNVLRKQFTDGQIDEMLRPAHVTYNDIVAFLHQGDEGQSASVLRTLFAGAASEALVTRWLADTQQDPAIVDKDATAELYKLIESRLGLAVPGGTTATEARDKTLRYVLISEFRADLGCEAPSSVSMVPIPPTREHVERIRDVATNLRRDFAERYVELADRVATELSLPDAQIDAAHLGSIDTFRFEEQRLLRHAGALVAAKDDEAALALLTARRRSFWVDRQVTRQAQWEAGRLLAELSTSPH